MDMLSHLPLPVKPNRVESTSRNASDSVSRSSRDNQVEETGAISFPGLLERNQELAQTTGSRTEVNNQETLNETNGQASGADSDSNKQNVQLQETALPAEAQVPAGPGNSTEGQLTALGNVSSTSQIMIGQMVKIQMGTAVVSNPADPELPAQVQSKATANLGGTQIQHPSLIDFQPTGGAVPAEGKIDLAGLKILPAAEAGQVPASNESIVQESGDPNVTVQKVQAAVVNNKTIAPAPIDTKMMDTTAKTPADLALATQAGPEMDSVKMAAQVQNTANQVPVNTVVIEKPAATVSDLPEAQAVEEEGSSELSTAIKATNLAEHYNPDLETHIAAQQTEASETDATESGQLLQELDTTLTQPRVTNTILNGSARSEAMEQGRQIRSQVLHQLSSTMDGRIGSEKVTLQLNPEKLGLVEIQFLAKGDELNIVITASSNESEQALREGIKELADGLVDKSGRWQHVDIKVDQRGQDQDKNDSRSENRRDQSRNQSDQKNQQQSKKHAQDGAPDWASLQAEG